MSKRSLYQRKKKKFQLNLNPPSFFQNFKKRGGEGDRGNVCTENISIQSCVQTKYKKSKTKLFRNLINTGRILTLIAGYCTSLRSQCNDSLEMQ